MVHVRDLQNVNGGARAINAVNDIKIVESNPKNALAVFVQRVDRVRIEL